MTGKRDNADYVYYVEGDCEDAFVQMLQRYGCVKPGTVRAYNPVNRSMSKISSTMDKKKKYSVLVFDTEEKLDPKMLKQNIKRMKQVSKDVLLIPQCPSFESEIEYCTDVNKAYRLFDVKSYSDFKDKFIRNSMESVWKILLDHGFAIKKLWSRTPSEPFHFIKSNDSHKIKLK